MTKRDMKSYLMERYACLTALEEVNAELNPKRKRGHGPEVSKAAEIYIIVQHMFGWKADDFMNIHYRKRELKQMDYCTLLDMCFPTDC